jgi:hypothetical protein
VKRALAIVAGVLLSGSLSGPAGAHHVGAFTPKDDELTKNFKDIKYASQAGRFDVALKLFDAGAVHATMERFEADLPRGLEDGLRAALKADDLGGVESRLARFLAFLTRERVRTALARLRESRGSPADRRERARKLLDAAWRYYNLVDFAISKSDPKASVTVRMAFEDAQTFLGGTKGDLTGATSRNATSTSTPGKARDPLSRDAWPGRSASRY